MTNEEMKQWIDNASYEQLLCKWRFGRIGDPFFQGEIGTYYSKMIRQRQKEEGIDAHIHASKKIGWES